MAPLVSVIVPNYNYSRTLRLCLAALRAQTYAPLEILVVDDRSTDDSVAVAESFGVTVLQPATNGGVSRARNLGAAHAAGEILFFLDSDVALAPDAVANAVAVLDGDPAIGAVCGNYDPQPLIRDSLVEEYRNFHQHFWIGALEGRLRGFVPTALLAVRARVFADVGPFNPKLRDTESAEYGGRLSERYDVRLSRAIRARHDNDDTLRVVLRKVFTRSRSQFALFSRDREVTRTVLTSPARAALAAALAAVTVPVPLLLGPVWAALPAVLLAVALRCDAPLYRAAIRYRGPAFGVFCMGMHTLVNLTIAIGCAAGLLQWWTSASYRKLHDPQSPPTTPAARTEPGRGAG
jgi:glycosyltransferase involved in cell wall biosynthesis